MQEEKDEGTKTKGKRKRPLLRVSNLDLTRVACEHIVGAKHTIHHRMACGFILMTIGVTISGMGAAQILIVKYICDGIGYLIHGIGVIPFAERVGVFVSETGAQET